MLTDICINSKSRRRWWVALAALVGLAVTSANPALSGEADETLRLRVAWGSGEVSRWTGEVSIDGGRLEQLALLGREADTPGSIWLDGGKVAIDEPRARNFDGFDITARGNLEATLRITMRAAGAEQPTTIAVPLAQLLREPHRSTLTSPTGEVTLLVRRVSDDALRIHLDGSSRIYRPGETLRMAVSPRIADLTPGGTLDLDASLAAERQSKAQWQQSQRLTLSNDGRVTAPVEIPLPEREGVYTVRLIARTPPGNRRFWAAGGGGGKLAERSFQIVVLADASQACYLGSPWQTLLTIDPANPSWWDRLPEWTRLDRLTNLSSSGPMGSEAHRSTNVEGKTLAQLSRSTAGRPTWQAYPMPAARPGEPHVVEIEVPTSTPQQLAVRIYEADASGKLTPTGPGGGAAVDEPAAGELATYRYLFWPRTNSPVVVVENLSEELPAAYGKISLSMARPSLTRPPAFEERPRMVAAMFDWPVLLERTTARALSADGRPAVDDCLTFYNAAVRTAALLELSGYNTAVINVLDDGSAAFDLSGGQSLPVLDTSRVANAATDLPPLDPTELMLRVFSRRGLRLVPTLRFTSTLPGVEDQWRRGKYTTREDFFIWTDLAGRPRRSPTPDGPRSSTPHYLATHPDVASEVQDVVNRLVAIASPHRSFAGVGIDLAADSYLALPPATYGVTAGRLAQLAQATGADEEALAGWQQKPQAIFDDANLRRSWLSLRAQAMSDWLAQMSAGLDGGDAELFLLTPTLFAHREFAPRPRRMDGPSLADLYLERGLDLTTLAEAARIRVLGTWHDTAGIPLVDAATGMELNAKRRRGASRDYTADLLWQHARVVDQPVGEALALGGPLHRRLSIESPQDGGCGALTYACFESGSTAPLVVGGPAGPAALGSERQRALLRLLGELPSRAAQPVESIAEQPVAARLYADDEGCTALVVNDSAWPVTAIVTLEVAERSSGWQMGSQNAATAADSYTPGQHLWTVPLARHDARLLRFDRPGVHIAGVRVQLPAEAEAQLAEAIGKLERRDLKPDNLPPYQAVKNPSFEEVDAAGMAMGWQTTAGTGVTTGSTCSHGQRAGLLQSTDGASSIFSETFATPATGEIAVTLDVNVVELSDDARLRLLVEEVGPSTPSRFIEMPADMLKANQQSAEWNVYQTGVEDLPFDSASKIRIRCELTGVGQVWIDNLQVHELVYPLHIYDEADQQVLALVQHVKRVRQALDAREFRTCQLLLDGYWSRFAVEHLPEIQQPVVETQPAAAEDRSDEAEAPRLSDRMRGWFRF